MITHKKNLRTGRPVWFAYKAPSIPFKTLTRDIKADVAVIGAGISGAMLAEELADAGFSVVILDRRGPLKGSTPASTALLQYEIDTPVIKLAEKIGFDDAARGWRRSKLGLESLAGKIRELDIQCDLERKRSVYLNGNILDAEGLQEERRARASIGLHAEFMDKKALKDLYGITGRSALVVRDSVSVNPRKLAAGFLLKAFEKGTKIYAPVTVSHVDTHKAGVDIHTDEGPVIHARYAIFATGYEMLKGLSLKKHRIHSTWAIATKPQPSRLWHNRDFIWEAAKPYLYMRTTTDGRVICGGEDEDFEDEQKRDLLIPQKTAILSRKLGKLFPSLDPKADYAWAGAFGGSATDMPAIGPVPGMKNCFAVLAFGGNGITFSRIAAEVIRAMLIGLEDPDADLFKVE